MKSFAFFFLSAFLVSLAFADIKIRRRREVEKEESKEEVLIKNGNSSMEVDVECDKSGRDIVKLFFDDQPLLPFGGSLSDSGIFDFFNRIRELTQAMTGDFGSTFNNLPVISNDTKTEVIERNGLKFLQTTTTIKRGVNETMMISHYSSLKPLNGQDPNEYEVVSPSSQSDN